MNPRLFVLPILALAACSGRPTPTTSEPMTQPTPAVTASAPATPQASPTPATKPDPVAAQREQLLARIEKLPESVCDELVLEFQLIARDEILDPLNKQKRELQRYVRKVAEAEDLAALDRAIKQRERKPPTLP